MLLFSPLDFTWCALQKLLLFMTKPLSFMMRTVKMFQGQRIPHYSRLAWITTLRENGCWGRMNIALLSDLTKQTS